MPIVLNIAMHINQASLFARADFHNAIVFHITSHIPIIISNGINQTKLVNSCASIIGYFNDLKYLHLQLEPLIFQNKEQP